MDSVGGYRLVRKLGEGPRAEVHLARDEGDPHTSTGLVVKLFRAGVEQASIATEIEALARSVGEHTVPLLDVTTAESGQLALILGRLSGGTLGRLLAYRSSLAIGEAVGVLIPIVETVHAMHAAGVVHRGMRADAVFFDQAGSPVLGCFGRAGLIQPGMPPALLDLEPYAELDRRALIGIVVAVLERVDDPDSVRPVLDWLASALPDSSWPASVATQLRALGAPIPVDLRASEQVATASPIPARVPVSPARPSETRRSPETRRARGAAAHRGPITDLLAGVVDGRGMPELRSMLQSVRTSLKRVRARAWIALGSVLVALACALVLVPSASGSPQAGPTSPPVVQRGTPTGPSEPASADPVEALVQLLQQRERCIRDRSVLCLDAVAQAGSAALARDQQLVLGLQDGAETPPPLTTMKEHVAVVEELGDAVVLSLDGVADDEPSTVLLVRGESGWRIRDYLD